ncbi:MAG TPA: RICIN domain-containing protein [Bacilli bacterium]
MQYPALAGVQAASAASSGRQMEFLDRGLIAVKVTNGVFVSWRMFGNDPGNIGFNLYRNGSKINSSPITTSTNYLDTGGTANSTYVVRPVINGTEQAPSEAVNVWGTNYLTVPLQKPAGGTTPDGVNYTYNANDASVGDLDGDGKYEIVLKWDPSNSKDNSQSGYTGNVYVDAYKLDGTRLWRINLGRNIRAGAHYTQFMVYDLDGDGKAEVAMKTADGTVDGKGAVIGNASADYRNSSGYILSGPEYLSIFNGQTGAAMATVNYDPPRGKVCDWGDCYGNRVDRFLAGIAYLDGTRPSLIMARGYYTRTVLTAYNWRNGQLTKLWKFDSNNSGYSSYAGQGNHNLSIGDADGDGKDEIVYGAMTVDDNGAGLYNTGLGHGDAMHFGDLNPNRAGLEVFKVLENSPYGAAVWDAANGHVIWRVTGNGDTGRGMAADIDPRHPGEEVWASNGVGLYTIDGTKLSSSTPSSINFGIWWDGDLLRELLDHSSGVGTISKWDYANQRTNTLLTANGAYSNNGTKGTPSLQADILGDWREEAVWRTQDSSALRIYTTTAVTNYRIYTLMHDPVYRLGVAWQNVAYNQPPHTSFFLGEGMAPPPVPNIYLVGGSDNGDGTGGTWDPNAYYMLVNRNSGKVADVEGGSYSDGANILQWSNHGGYNQQWRIVDAGGGYYKLINRNSGKAMAVDGNSTANGANILQWTDNGSSGQQWQISDIGNGYYKLVNRNSGKVADVEGLSTADGGNILQWQDNGGYNQQWQIIKVQ